MTQQSETFKPFKYSLSSFLKKNGKIDNRFEMMLNNLSLDEIIGLKVELSAKAFLTNKFYGFPLWKNLPKIIRSGLLLFAMKTFYDKEDAAMFLGITYKYYLKLIEENEREFRQSLPEYNEANISASYLKINASASATPFNNSTNLGEKVP